MGICGSKHAAAQSTHSRNTAQPVKNTGIPAVTGLATPAKSAPAPRLTATNVRRTDNRGARNSDMDLTNQMIIGATALTLMNDDCPTGNNDRTDNIHTQDTSSAMNDAPVTTQAETTYTSSYSAPTPSYTTTSSSYNDHATTSYSTDTGGYSGGGYSGGGYDGGSSMDAGGGF